MSRAAQGNLYPDDARYAPNAAENYAQRLTGPELGDDETLRREVQHALAGADFDASGLEIEARDGRVTLRGKIHGSHDRAKAIALAQGVVGVTDVQSELRLEH